MSAINRFCEKCNGLRKKYCDGDRDTCMFILFDTIESLQEENEQLRAQLDEWKYEVKCHMDEVIAREKQMARMMKQEFFLMEFDGIKRAVKYFKIIRKKHIGGTSDFYDLAINALERQIPQKPCEHYHWGDFTKEEKLENNQWFCGKCGWQIGEEDNYCNECGQRVDWS